MEIDRSNDESKGWAISYIRWDDCKPCIAGRFKTTKDKDEFLEKIYMSGSGWTEDELYTISVHNDYNWMLPY